MKTKITKAIKEKEMNAEQKECVKRAKKLKRQAKRLSQRTGTIKK